MQLSSLEEGKNYSTGSCKEGQQNRSLSCGSGCCDRTVIHIVTLIVVTCTGTGGI